MSIFSETKTNVLICRDGEGRSESMVTFARHANLDARKLEGGKRFVTDAFTGKPEEIATYINPKTEKAIIISDWPEEQPITQKTEEILKAAHIEYEVATYDQLMTEVRNKIKTAFVGTN